MIARGTLTLLVALTACRGKDEPAVERRPTVELDTIPRLESVRLLAPGTGDRQLLRYTLAAPSTHAIETTVTARQLEGAAWSEPRTLPPMQSGFTVTPASDALRVRTLPGTTTGAWALIADRTFSITSDDRGRASAFAIADQGASGAAIVDELAQRWLALVVPLPEEPVAVGATWRAVTVLRQRPAIVKQTATYTLTSRTAERWEIGVELSRVAAPQQAIDPGVPEGTQVDVVALVTRLGGTLAIDPRRPLPTGELTLTSTLHLRLRGAAGVTEQIYDDTAIVRAR